MKAILSDIHGNLEALNAVLGDIARRGVDSIYNLGDITGYGPDPIACIDLSMDMSVVLRGNFDDAVVSTFDLSGFALHAGQSIAWTRSLLASPAEADHRRRVDFLAGLQSIHREPGVLYVHGSPARPLHEYVFPYDIPNRQKMERIGGLFDHLCFNGHTHVPGIFVESGSDGWRFLSPEECGFEFQLDDRKVLCNVGSVGQPRDGDWRAGYVLFDGRTVSFRRVEYDVEATIARIYSVPELGDFSGDRLRDGR